MVVVVGASVVVVVVGAWLVVDAGVPVSDWVDDGALLCVAEVSDVPGLAGVVLTLEVGVLGVLDVCRSAIMTPLPMASTASAVPTATTTGRRYQTSAIAVGTGSRSKSSGISAAASGALFASSEYSPGRIGMMPESSSASDHANAGAGLGSAGTPDRVVASAIDPAAVGASAVSPSAGPRAAPAPRRAQRSDAAAAR